MGDVTTREALNHRIGELRDFLRDEYPETFDEQRHLDKCTEARGYYHYGYLSALTDIRKHLFPEGNA